MHAAIADEHHEHHQERDDQELYPNPFVHGSPPCTLMRVLEEGPPEPPVRIVVVILRYSVGPSNGMRGSASEGTSVHHDLVVRVSAFLGQSGLLCNTCCEVGGSVLIQGAFFCGTSICD